MIKKIFAHFAFLVFISSCLINKNKTQNQLNSDNSIDIEMAYWDTLQCEQIKVFEEKDITYSDLRLKGLDSMTLFHKACLCGNNQLVDRLYSSNINKSDDLGNTGLIYAIINKNKNIVKFLVGKGANLKVKNKLGETTLIVLAKNFDDAEIASLLINEAGNVLAKQNSMPAIEYTIFKRNNQIFDKLFNFYVKNKLIKKKEFSWWVDFAISNPYALDRLLSYDNSVNMANLLESAAMKSSIHHTTVHLGQGDSLAIKTIPYDLDIMLFDVLIKHGADINTKFESDKSIFFLIKDDYPLIKHLVKKGANLNLINKEKETFLQFFIKDLVNPEILVTNIGNIPFKNLERDYSEEFSVVDLFVQNKGIVNTPYKNGWTYLIVESLKANKKPIVEKLIKSEKYFQ